MLYWCLHIKGWGGAGPVGSPTNQVPASLSPAPLGWRFLTPVPSSSGWHLTWGESAGPLRWFLLGEGSAPPSVSLGESWPPGRRVGKEPSSLCAWRWAKHLCLCSLSHLVLNSPRR